MPGSIVEAVEEVQKHWAHIAGGLPVSWDKIWVELGIDAFAGVGLLIGVSTAPYGKGEDEENDPGNLRSDGTANPLDIEQVSPDDSRKDLSEEVQKTVKSLGAGTEVSTINGVLLVDVEPVRGEEHGEKQNHEWLKSKGFPKAQQLRLPARMLHQDDAAAVGSDNVASVAEAESKQGTDEHQDDEANVRTVGDGNVGLDMDVFTEGNLIQVNLRH